MARKQKHAIMPLAMKQAISSHHPLAIGAKPQGEATPLAVSNNQKAIGLFHLPALAQFASTQSQEPIPASVASGGVLPTPRKDIGAAITRIVVQFPPTTRMGETNVPITFVSSQDATDETIRTQTCTKSATPCESIDSSKCENPQVQVACSVARVVGGYVFII